jgi:hypothetical protein
VRENKSAKLLLFGANNIDQHQISIHPGTEEPQQQNPLLMEQPNDPTGTGRKKHEQGNPSSHRTTKRNKQISLCLISPTVSSTFIFLSL